MWYGHRVNVVWSQDECGMVTGWLWHGHRVNVVWSQGECGMVTGWMWYGHRANVVWSQGECGMVTGWMWYGHRVNVAWSQGECGMVTGWMWYGHRVNVVWSQVECGMVMSYPAYFSLSLLTKYGHLKSACHPWSLCSYCSSLRNKMPRCAGCSIHKPLKKWKKSIAWKGSHIPVALSYEGRLPV